MTLTKKTLYTNKSEEISLALIKTTFNELYIVQWGELSRVFEYEFDFRTDNYFVRMPYEDWDNIGNCIALSHKRLTERGQANPAFLAFTLICCLIALIALCSVWGNNPVTWGDNINQLLNPFELAFNWVLTRLSLISGILQ